MPTINIHLRTEEIGDKDFVTAHPNAGNTMFRLKNHKLHIHNKLDEGKATVTFHGFFNKDLEAPLTGFCKNHPDKTEFVIANQDKLVCEPDATGDYTYIAQGEGHETLDPVIIIKPDFYWAAQGPTGPDGEQDAGAAAGIGGIGTAALLSVVVPPVIGVLGGMVLANRFALKFKGL